MGSLLPVFNLKVSNKIYLTGFQLLAGVCWEGGVDPFKWMGGGGGGGGGYSFYIKNKLKSEIFNDKKSI